MLTLKVLEDLTHEPLIAVHTISEWSSQSLIGRHFKQTLSTKCIWTQAFTSQGQRTDWAKEASKVNKNKLESWHNKNVLVSVSQLLTELSHSSHLALLCVVSVTLLAPALCHPGKGSQTLTLNTTYMAPSPSPSLVHSPHSQLYSAQQGEATWGHCA